MGRAARWLVSATGATAAVLAAVLPVLAQPDPSGRSWPEEKCARYSKAWTELLARRGRQGLGPDFLARHEAFLAAGCTGRADVCPRSPEELDLANILVILAMNAGSASTFLPFACRPPAP